MRMAHILSAITMLVITCSAFGAQTRTFFGINRGNRAQPGPILIQPYPQTMMPVVVTNAEGIADPATLSNPVIIQISLTGEFADGVLDPQYIDDILYHLNNPPLIEFNIVGILLIIDSPGGVNVPIMFANLKEYKDNLKIPAVAFCEDIAASAGYWLACVADYILASRSAEVGSVGVILSEYFNYKKQFVQGTFLAESALGGNSQAVNLAPNWSVLRQGPWYARGLPFETWSANEFDALNLGLDDEYAAFVSVVSTARPKLTAELLVNTLGAKIFAANSALQLGYIDEAPATRADAIKKIVELSNAGSNYRVIELVYVDSTD